MHQPSAYQQAVYDAITDTQDNLLIQAVAGSGKTTTSIHGATLVDPQLKIVFVAFSKDISVVLQQRLPSHVKAQTLHSLGFGVIRNNTKTRVDNRKVPNLLRYEYLDKDNKDDVDYFFKVRNFVTKIISLFKAHIMKCPTHEDIDALAAKFGIEIPDIKDRDPYQTAIDVYSLCRAEYSRIDFDDMVFMPIDNGWAFPKHDVVFVDEAQDMNLVQIEMVKRLNARVIAVGDVNQAIYGFRGADAEAMQKIKTEFNCTELPLSICYRCAEVIVGHAKKIVPQIEWAPNAEGGVILNIKEDDLQEKAEEGDYVLCRTTAPLVSHCLRFIRNDIPAVILGRDIGEQIAGLVKRVSKSETVEAVLEGISDHQAKMAKRFGDDDAKMQTVEDQCATIRVICESVSGYNDIFTKIESLFADKGKGVTFCTVHKSKGLEAENVFILRPDLIPHPMAKLPWQQVQESNLEYVAITRAMKKLTYVKKG
jgi:superfamily I DNA/RNA helicase